jgi:hypothetical protein
VFPWTSLRKPTFIDSLIQELKVEHPDVNRDPASPARRNYEIAAAPLALSLAEHPAGYRDFAIRHKIMTGPNIGIVGHLKPPG